MYGVETKALNQAVKRNAEKFPTGYILKMTDEEVYALLATDGMLVKRPIIVTENYVLTGFKEAEWQEKMKK